MVETKMSGNFDNILKRLKECLSIIEGSSGPLSAHSRISKKLSKASSHLSSCSHGKATEAIHQITLAHNDLERAVKAASSYRTIVNNLLIANTSSIANTGTAQSTNTQHTRMGPEFSGDTGGNYSSHIRLLEINTYSTLKKKEGRKGLEMDHIPSKGALIEYFTKLKGEPLSKHEKNIIVNSAPAMAVPKELHANCSRTYRGRNTKSMIIGDANDIKQAVSQDLSRYSAFLSEQGCSSTDISAMQAKFLKIIKDIKL